VWSLSEAVDSAVFNGPLLELACRDFAGGGCILPSVPFGGRAGDAVSLLGAGFPAARVARRLSLGVGAGVLD